MNPLISLDSVGLAFGHLPLLEGASLLVEPGERIALIGRNGAGKSSLLKVLSGEMPPDAGTVWRAPGIRVARLDQDVPGEGTRTVFDEVAAGPRRARARSSPTITTPPCASPRHPATRRRSSGWACCSTRSRSATAGGSSSASRWSCRGCRCRPIADAASSPAAGGGARSSARRSCPSPICCCSTSRRTTSTSTPSAGSRTTCANYGGALLFVTHDRAFLSALATRIVELDRGRLTSWPGDYANYLQKKAEALETEARDLDRLDKKLEKEEAWLRQGVKARRTRNEGRVKDLMALRAERAAYRAQSGTVRLAIDSGEATGKLVFEAKEVSKSFGGVPVVRDYSQRILRGDRVGLIGPNGSGQDDAAADAGRASSRPIPERSDTARACRSRTSTSSASSSIRIASVVDSVNDGNDTVVVNGQPRHVIGYLADFLFPRERAQSPVKSLSGGERNRLMLARLFARPANVLVLDEPTNDLDIETLELLEELIGGFAGTVLLVSHDRVFLDNVVTSTLAFEGEGRVVEYVGGYEDYLRQRRERRGPARRRAPSAGTPSAERQAPSRRARASCPSTSSASSSRCPRTSRRSRRSSSGCSTRSASPEFYKEPAGAHPRRARADRRDRARARSRAGPLDGIGRTDRRPATRLALERLREQILDGPLAVVVDLARAGAGEVRMRDDGRVLRAALPVAAGPFEPAVLLLVEDEQRLVTQLRELGAPAGAAAHGAVVEDCTDHVDLLAVVHLVPQRLQDLPDRSGCRCSGGASAARRTPG